MYKKDKSHVYVAVQLSIVQEVQSLQSANVLKRSVHASQTEGIMVNMKIQNME